MAARPPLASPARALLLALAAVLFAPRAARGVSLWDQEGAYEVASAFLLNGDLGIPVKSDGVKDHPEVLNVRMQLESRELVINLERNEGLIASGFTETHYLQDGTDVSLTRNYTGHCYYHGHVQGHDDSLASISACSGLR
uniref:disintegrin and metalloproteinase domain-containing protein 12-like n=1 Tax=Ictidomys tridecemlineatus TaxID=43179 RepID=UPI001A9D29C9|nr:disintegrin and metalloproteinase domain-containing protein 12-like [Ictidomys tridecemlineatus]